MRVDEESLLDRLRVQRGAIEELQAKRARDQAEIRRLKRTLRAVDELIGQRWKGPGLKEAIAKALAEADY